MGNPSEKFEEVAKCPYCGKVFVKHDRRQIYCSRRCSNLAAIRQYRIRKRWKKKQAEGEASYTIKRKLSWQNVSEWVADNIYYPDSETGEIQPLRLTPIQAEALSALADHQVVVVCVPKRQGKTLISATAALYNLYRNYPSTTLILSTSKDHAVGVTFRRIRELVFLQAEKNDKYRRDLRMGRLKVTHSTVEWKFDAEFAATSVIEAVPCVVEAVAGRMFDLLIVDELALIDDEEVVSVVLSQTERKTTRVLITSTASDTDHLLYRLYLQSQQNPNYIHFIYRHGWDFYRSPECNPLVTESFLRQRQLEMTPQLFSRYFLNEFGGDTSDAVFTEVDECVKDIPPSPEIPEAVTWQTFVGIDRALPHSKHADLSAGVLLYKVLTKSGETLYIVGDCQIFPTGGFEEIWAWITHINERNPIAQLVFEVYQCYDLFDAARGVGIPTKLVHVNTNNKRDAFNKLYALMAKRQLIIPSKFTELVNQLKDIKFKGGKYQAGRGHDDLVYALVWATDAATDTPIFPFFFDFFNPFES